MFLRFNDIDNSDNLLPNDVLKENGNVNLDWSIRILKGQKTEIKMGDILVRTIAKNNEPVVPYGHHISYCLDFVKNTSNALSHIYSYEFGKSIFPACLGALIEILEWSNKFIVKKYYP